MKVFWIAILLIFSFNVENVDAGTSEPRFVFVGDSNTASVQWENGSYVVKLLDLGYPWDSLDLINSGEDGWGAYSYYNNPSLINQYILQYEPDFVLIALGGNDFLRFSTAEEFEEYYNYLITQLLDVSERCKISQIYLANIYWGSLDLGESLITKYIEFQEIISQTGSDYSLPVIDFYSTTLNRTEFYTVDPIHLNEEGHIAIANTINSTIREDVISKISTIPSADRSCDLTVPTTSNSITDISPISSNNSESSFKFSQLGLIIPIMIWQKSKLKKN